jgi:uroporphyrinogen decarboxylase
MNHRENFHRMMRQDGPERLPKDMWTTPPFIDLLEKHRGTRNVVEAFDLTFEMVTPAWRDDPAKWRAALEGLGYVVPEGGVIGGCGRGHRKPAAESVGAAYHMTEPLHPLSIVESVEQFESLPWPNVDDPEHYAPVPDRARQVQDGGRAAIGVAHCTIFEVAWGARGMDHLFMDLAEGNGIAEWLFDFFERRADRMVRAYARAGVDVVAFGDDVGTQRGMMMSVDMWREHLKPRLDRLIAAVREEQVGEPWIFYHSDGDIRDILDDLAEIGVQIINPMQPECMPIADVVADHKHHLGFWGMIGTQTTMPFGSPEDVRAAVAEVERFARDGASVVVSPTHMLEPDVPWENVEALVNAVQAVRM